ncbi:MAG: hypothetical protein OXN20_18135 [Gemmatimonadota bacterium]|nr:hypothetical protein [Gemmatimonadota bacterium]
MPENSFEHTTSIAGLTCKPLSILSEAISTQEMNMARGGTGGKKNKCEDEDPIDWNTGPTFSDIISSIFGPTPGSGTPQSPDFGHYGPQISPAEMFSQGDPIIDWTETDNVYDPDALEEYFYSDQMAPEEDNSGNCGEGEDDDENCEYCDDENCDGDCANDEEDGEEDGLFDGFETTGQDNTRVGN